MSAFIGIISYLGANTPCLESRIKMHNKQLEEMSWDFNAMKQMHNLEPLSVVRVEQDWDTDLQKKLSSKQLNIHHIERSQLTPGAARNILLNQLYESDYDWLVCSDDDHWIYAKYSGIELLYELSVGTARTIKLAKQGYAFSAFPAYWEGFQKDVNNWGKSETHWLFTKTKHPGAMPFCCIPNIKKYFGKEIYFNEETNCYSVDAPPEDLQFYIDWLISGFKWFDCMCMIGKSMGNLDDSSLFESREYRKERDKSVKQWRDSYLKQKFPRQPQLWVWKEFNSRRNNIKMVEIPRFNLDTRSYENEKE